VDQKAKRHFDAVVGSFDINRKHACGPMGNVQNGEAYNLYQGLIDLTRGIYFALDDFDSRLNRLEQAIAPQKSAKPRLR
jgi:hypothetical protein